VSPVRDLRKMVDISAEVMTTRANVKERGVRVVVNQAAWMQAQNDMSPR